MIGRIDQAVGHCGGSVVNTDLTKLHVHNATHTGESLVGNNGHLGTKNPRKMSWSSGEIP